MFIILFVSASRRKVLLYYYFHRWRSKWFRSFCFCIIFIYCALRLLNSKKTANIHIFIFQFSEVTLYELYSQNCCFSNKRCSVQQKKKWLILVTRIFNSFSSVRSNYLTSSFDAWTNVAHVKRDLFMLMSRWYGWVQRNQNIQYLQV